MNISPINYIAQKQKVTMPIAGYGSSFETNSPLVDQFIKTKAAKYINTNLNIKTNENTINQALAKLEEATFTPNDINYMKNLGINIIFNSGKEIIDHINKNNIKIKYDKPYHPKIHAQWSNTNNTIIINEKYKNTKNLAEILAIAASIAHEAGHSRDQDYMSSIQEEMDCLAMNTLVNRYHQNKYPESFKNEPESDILDDGVMLYTKLFFNKDKQPLEDRIKEKYGNLPLESMNHPASTMAQDIKNIAFV